MRSLADRAKRPRVALCGAGILVLLLASYWWWTSGTAAKTNGPPAVTVDAVSITRTDVPVYLEGLGAVQAFYTVTITPRVDGEVDKVGFVEGQAVKKGDLIAQIDPRPFRAALEFATATEQKDEAQLANAKLDLARYNVLAPQDFTSKQTVDTQRALVAQLDAQVKGDQASVDNAHTQLDYTTITSPIDGRTGIRHVDPGNIVHASDTSASGGIVTVTQVQPITVVFTLPEDDLPAVNAALAEGSVEVIALSRDENKELDRGKLALVDNQIDQTTGTIRAKAVFPNTHNALWPGAFVNARVRTGVRHNAITIPTAAIQRGPDGLFTYVVMPDGTVAPQAVKVGVESGASAVVDEGSLEPGMRVVTSNQYRLQPGAKVKIADSSAVGKNAKADRSKP